MSSHLQVALSGVIPALVAMWIVDRLDAKRPEPPRLRRLVVLAGIGSVIPALLLEILLSNTIGARLEPQLTYQGSSFQAFVVAAATEELCKILAVYWVVWRRPEFDERMDGIVYGTVAGLGVAKLLNLHYVIDNDGVALGPGVIHVVTTALAQASFGGLLGYFMAQAKFEHRPVWWVPLGFVIAAVLNGVFTWLMSEISASGLSVQPLRSLALGLVVALAVFGLLLALMRRATQSTLAPAGG